MSKLKCVEYIQAGTVHLKVEQDRMVVVAKACAFPFLLHELAKGTLEVLALHGLPEDRSKRQQVLAAADGLDHEPWDLRLGPPLWAHLIGLSAQAGVDKTRVFRNLVSLSPNEFSVAIREIDINSELALDIVRNLGSD